MVRRLGMVLASTLIYASSIGCGGSPIGSIGALLGRDPDTGALHVRGVPDGEAAARAGLLPGDEIVFIDGRDVRDLEVPALRNLLRGDPGTRVDLTLLRGNQVVRVRIERTALADGPPKKPEGEEKLEE